MKKIVLLSLAVCLFTSSYSQLFKASLSEEFKITEKIGKNHVVSNAVSFKGSFYSIYMEKSTGASKWLFTKIYDIRNALEISKYDRNMKLKTEVNVEKGAKNFAILEPELIHFNDQLLVGYFKPYKKESFDYYISIVDTNTLAFSSTVKLFSLPVKNVGILRAGDFETESPVRYSLSPDKQRMLFAAVLDGTSVNVQVLGHSLQTERQYTVPIGGTGKYKATKAIFNDEGHIVLSLYNDGEDRKLLTINPAGKSTLHPLNNLVPGKYPYPLECTLSRDQQTVYLYAAVNNNKKDDLYCHGIFLLPFDLKQNKRQPSINYPFTQEFMTALVGKGAVKSANILYVFTFTPQLTELDNGELVLTGTPVLRHSETTQSGNGKSTNWNVFEAGSVLSFFIDKTSGKCTPSFVPRYIYLNMPNALSSPFSRVHIVRKPASIAIVYMDYEKNVNQPLDKPVYTSNSPNGLVLAEAEVMNTATVTNRRQLGQNMEGNYTYYMNLAVTEPGQDFLLIPIGKQGLNFNALRDFYTHWCTVELVGK